MDGEYNRLQVWASLFFSVKFAISRITPEYIASGS